MALVLGVLGSNKSGKTSTIEFLVSSLKKDGFRVGSAKHVHHPDFTIDKEGKDTWRHMHSGSEQVVCLSEDEVAVIRKEKGHKYDLERLLNLFTDKNLDIIVLEGFHWLISQNSEVVKIVTANSRKDAIERLSKVVTPILAVTGKITNTYDRGLIDGISIIDLKKNGDQLLKNIAQYFDLK